MRKALLLFFLIMFSGCTLPPPTLSPASPEITVKYEKDNLCFNEDPCMCIVCKNETLSTWWARFWYWITGNPIGGGVSSMRNGHCWIDKDCASIGDSYPPAYHGKNKFTEIYFGENPDKVKPNLKYFMVGQGPSFTAFDEANRYCNGSLGFAVKWMIGKPTTKLNYYDGTTGTRITINGVPMLPRATRAACYLDRNTIPVYLYHVVDENGKRRSLTDNDVKAIGYIAKELMKDPERKISLINPEKKDLGFVMIAPQIEFEASEVDKIKEQIRAIKANCPNVQAGDADVNHNWVPEGALRCAVVAVPKDRKALVALLGDPGPAGSEQQLCKNGRGNSEMCQKVDFIGLYGLMNKNVDCEPERSVAEMIEYSKWILWTYGIPTIWLYYGVATRYKPPFPMNEFHPDFQPGQPVGTTSPTNEDFIQCEITDEIAADAVDFMFSHIPDMTSAGIIGFAGYQWYDGRFYTGEIARENVEGTEIEGSFGFWSWDSGTNEFWQKNPFFSMWFRRCQEYYNVSRIVKKSPGVFRMESDDFLQVPLVFAGRGANLSFCDAGDVYQQYMNILGETEPDPKIEPERYKEFKAYRYGKPVNCDANCQNCEVGCPNGQVIKKYPDGVCRCTIVPMPRYFGCEYCLSPPKPPREWVAWGGGPLPPIQSPDPNTGVSPDPRYEKICVPYDYLIRENAEKCEFDPLMVRAVMWLESEFDQYAVSCESTYGVRDDDTSGCLINTPASPEKTSALSNCPHGDEGIACGLMQTISSTNTMTSMYGKSVCGPDLSCGDPNGYNPFKPAENICCGVSELCNAWEEMKRFVESESEQVPSQYRVNPAVPQYVNVREELGLSGDPEEYWDRWVIMFFTLLAYNRGVEGAKQVFWDWISLKYCRDPGPENYCERVEDPDTGDVYYDNCCDSGAQSWAGYEWCRQQTVCCRDGGSDPDGNPAVCGSESDFFEFACVYNVVPGAADQTNYPCKVIARFDAIFGEENPNSNTGCEMSCKITRGPGIGGITGGGSNCVTSAAAAYLGCPYLYGGGHGGYTGVSCIGTDIITSPEDTCGSGSGMRTTIPGGSPRCVTEVCNDAGSHAGEAIYLDCSGFVARAYADCGYTFLNNRGAADMCSASGAIRIDNPSELRPGDIIINRGGSHVVMYFGGGEIIEAPKTCLRVRKRPLMASDIGTMCRYPGVS
ncbi:MAG: NlpC/P60 family protein [Candidatus Micrarchaeia archaeon]